MNRPPDKTPEPNDWRSLKKNTIPPPASRIGQKRRAYAMLKTICILLVVCACGLGGYYLYHTWENDPQSIKAPVKSEPLKTITLRSDGVLNRAWVEKQMALPKDIALIELDLFALRDRLLANPQVRTAVLTRQFPDTLSIILEERSPVARIMVQTATGDSTEYLIARDGVVFVGENYRQTTIDALSWLADVRLRRVAPGSTAFEPVPGMDSVSDLIETARSNIPSIYAGWRSISLKRLAADGVLVVDSRDYGQIIFGTRDDFYKQVAQLDTIVDSIKGMIAERGAPRMIDLSVGDTASGVQVPVTFNDTPATNGSGGSRRTTAPTRPSGSSTPGGFTF